METDTAQDRRADLERKIRGLLKKAESTPFEHEADAFIRKAQELMIAHSISEETLWANDPDKVERIEERTINIASSQMGAQDKRRLINKIARLSNCESWYMTGRNEHVICGYPSDLMWIEILYTSIVTQANFKMAMGLAVNDSRIHTKVFKNNWWYEFVNTVGVRLEETYGAAKRETTKLPMFDGKPGSMELVLKDRKQRVADYVNSKYKFTTTSGSRSMTHSAEARSLGRMAGKETDLSGGKPRMGRTKELGR